MDDELLKWLEGRLFPQYLRLNALRIPQNNLLMKHCSVCADTQQGEEAQSGSTATVVLARNDKIVVANVGDSRAVLSRGGHPQDLSTEHR